ncbi:MAG TPA: hypothetical protein VN814_13775 [Caulobacteraceae bacterium]|nr:hypothetical protein [Caulobacteraceae bacterium]
MSAVNASPAQISLGRVIAAGFQLMAQRPVSILALTVALAYVPSIASIWTDTHLVGGFTPAGAPDYLVREARRFGGLELVGFVVAGVNWMFQGSVALFALAAAVEPDADPIALAGRLPGRWPLSFGFGMVATAAVALGTLALIVPGLLLALAWGVAPAVVAVERRGFPGVFRRSAELTRGNRGSLFGLFLIYGVVRAVSTYGLRFAFGAPIRVGAGSDMLNYGLQPVLSAALSAVYACVMAATYLELRGLHEGARVGTVAGTFD